jgi:hypothetical protein
MASLAMLVAHDAGSAGACATPKDRDPHRLSERQRKRQEKLARRAERARRDEAAKAKSAAAISASQGGGEDILNFDGETHDPAASDS